MKGVLNESAYMDATYKKVEGIEDRLKLQDIKRGKANVGGIAKVDHCTDQGMDEGSDRMRRMRLADISKLTQVVEA